MFYFELLMCLFYAQSSTVHTALVNLAARFFFAGVMSRNKPKMWSPRRLQSQSQVRVTLASSMQSFIDEKQWVLLYTSALKQPLIYSWKYPQPTNPVIDSQSRTKIQNQMQNLLTFLVLFPIFLKIVFFSYYVIFFIVLYLIHVKLY